MTEALLDAYPEAASVTNNYGNLALHFTAWKKGPLDVEKLLLKVFPEGAAQKNNHGNLPLHYAAHYNAPLEVVEALYKAFPDAAFEKNNDNNTPLDLAIADGASPHVVALLQGKSVPPSDDEYFDSAKERCGAFEKELQRNMEGFDDVQEDLDGIFNLLLDVKKNHPHALYSAGIDPTRVTNADSLLSQLRATIDDQEEKAKNDLSFGGDESQLFNTTIGTQGSIYEAEDDVQLIEESMIPPDDEVEQMLATIVGLEPLKNQIRGMRRTLEIRAASNTSSGKVAPKHLALVGRPGSGKTYVSKILASIMYKIGAVRSPTVIEVGRTELIDRKSEARTIQKTKRILDQARGGVLFVDEAYTLLPSPARSRASDHGASALRELAKSFETDNGPLIILAGYVADLQTILMSDFGFKRHFLTKILLSDPTPQEIARMFFSKFIQKGFVPGDGLTVTYVAQQLASHTEEEWRAERNGRIAEILFHACRNEIKSRLLGKEEQSVYSLSPRKLMQQSDSKKIPFLPPEDVVFTAEDIQNVLMNGL